MGYTQRKALIKKLEDKRGSRVVSCYFGDRPSNPDGVPGFVIAMTMEVQTALLTILSKMEHVEKLDLLLYTRGGATDCVWPIVNALRSRTDELCVLVPHRAHSAGTMVCLGADEVVMTELAELSPIDATTGNQFNPRDPINPQNQYGISVEDVASYFELAQRLGGIKDDQSRLEVFRQLTTQVHPLALGNVERVHQLIRRLAEQLLTLHLDATKDKSAIKRIIDSLTKEFYSHTHTVMRTEAEALFGDWLKAPEGEVEVALLAAHEAYVSDLHLRDKFNLPTYLADDPVRDLDIVAGFVETTDLSFLHRTALRIMQRPNLPPGVQVQVPPGQTIPLVPWVERAYNFAIQELGWVTNNEGV